MTHTAEKWGSKEPITVEQDNRQKPPQATSTCTGCGLVMAGTDRTHCGYRCPGNAERSSAAMF